MFVRLAAETGSALPFSPLPDDSLQILARSKLMGVKLETLGPQNSKVERVARHASRADPLDFRPFLLTGASAQAQGSYGQAATLLEAARKRQPRDFNTRLLLMQAYIGAGKYEKGVQEILAGSRFRAVEGARLMQALALMGQEPSVRNALISAFTKRPDWRRQFVGSEPAVKAAPDLVYDVAASSRANNVDRDVAVNALAGAGKLELAYRLWTSSRQQGEGQLGKFPTDPDFEGWAQKSVFGWKLLESGEAVAELVDDNISGTGKLLDVEYFGGGSAAVVEQFMLLRPGHFTLAISGKHQDGQSGDSTFRWTINCEANPRPIAILKIASAASNEFLEQAGFDIPRNNCAFQKIRLMIVPGEMDRTMRTSFTSVRVN